MTTTEQISENLNKIMALEKDLMSMKKTLTSYISMTNLTLKKMKLLNFLTREEINAERREQRSKRK